MNKWLQFLHRPSQDAKALDGDEGVLDFTSAGSPASGFVSPLTDLGLIALTGDDAATFLHHQITNDVAHLTPGQARLAGYCTPKGRLLATFLMWKRDATLYLQLPLAIQPAIQKRLQMYILRSKVTLTDANGNHVALGIAGEAAASVLSAYFPLPAVPYAKTDSAAGSLMRMVDANGLPRYLWIANPDVAEQAWRELTAVLPAADPCAWRLTDIAAGIPRIVSATQERFVPQMINFELIGGVSFKKGCYPGQEIVARSQYLGKLKRRMLLAWVDTPDAKAGNEIFLQTEPEQPCGLIVNAERLSAQASHCLVEMQLAALEAGSVHLGSANGPPLHFQALPYALKDPGKDADEVSAQENQ